MIKINNLPKDYRLAFISYFIKQNYKSMLDVSCGNGSKLEYWKQKGFEVSGTEFDDEKIKLNNEKGIKCKKVDLNEEKLPYEDNSFDVVTLLDVAEHLKNPEKAVSEVFRVAKKLAIVIVPFGASYDSPEHINYWFDSSHLAQRFKFLPTDTQVFLAVSKPEDWRMNQRMYVLVVNKNDA